MFAEWLIGQLAAHRWGKAELSRRSGVSIQTLTEYLNGAQPSKESLAAIAGALTISVDEINLTAQAAGERKEAGRNSSASVANEIKPSRVPDEIDFSVWMHDQLQRRGWTVAEMYRMGGPSPAVMSRALSGARTLAPESCNAIAKALDVPAHLVFEAAGLLPPSGEMSQEQEEVVALMAEIPERWRGFVVDAARSCRDVCCRWEKEARDEPLEAKSEQPAPAELGSSNGN